MPKNTIYVGRPSRWGNQWIVGVSNYPAGLSEHWTLEQCLNAYKGWLEFKVEDDSHFLDELKGKDLACWCALDKPCNADILLDMLNSLPNINVGVSLGMT